MKHNFVNELNPSQRNAVVHTNGPSLVIAGAGSGKTRVLTYKIAYLLTQGIDSFNILALTFTNKAAREMKERILGLVGHKDASNVWMGTFHSIFARILRKEGHRLGYPSNFTIYDTDDAKRLIRNIVKELNLDDKQYQASYILNRISSAKSSLISPQEYNTNGEVIAQDKAAGKPFLGKIYQIYAARLYKSSAMDFDDLLFNMNILLRDFPEVLYRYQQKFEYILVDEYQDTNYAQYLIVKKLAANNENLCVVGDDAQSIYAFRGANIQNILNLKKDYPELTIFKLEQNYRSTGNIVKAANSVIAKNKDQIFKEIWTENDEGEKIRILKTNTDNEEGMAIANTIFELKMTYQKSDSDFAVLYRTNAQSRAIEEALRKLNIPYRIYGGISFYSRKEVKDLLAYFRLVVNVNDEEALLRIINYPARGIGKTTLDKLIATAGETNKTIWEIIDSIETHRIGLSNAHINKLKEFVTMIKSFIALQTRKSAYDVASYIASTSGLLKELYTDRTPEGVSRYENIEELLNAIKEFTERPAPEGSEDQADTNKLAAFMQEVSLLTDADKKEDENARYVSLMTIHAAKGLEFPYVFVSGVEENLFPSQLSMSSRAELEEERRLFYVAITRAMKQVFLTYAQTRYKWGNLISCEPSRFIDEIDPVYIDIPLLAAKKAKTSYTNPPSAKIPLKQAKQIEVNKATGNYDALPEQINQGMEVEHPKFGKGTVLEISGVEANRTATVLFNGFGKKQLLLKFAKLKIL